MNKLQYDSLYKFLVSLGIVMIVVPVFVLAYLVNRDLVIINQNEFESLSELSKEMILNQNIMLNYVRVIFPYFAVTFIIAGIALVFIGIKRWNTVQKNLDKKLDAEATIQTLNALKMAPEEVNGKIESSVSETDDENINSKEKTAIQNNNILKIKEKYIEILDKYSSYASVKYGEKYQLIQDVKMGAYEYDLIGVSDKDNVDLIFEVKYWITPKSASDFFRLCNRAKLAGENYATVAHRKFKFIITIITPEKQLPEMKSWMSERMYQIKSDTNYNFKIECISEESL